MVSGNGQASLALDRLRLRHKRLLDLDRLGHVEVAGSAIRLPRLGPLLISACSREQQCASLLREVEVKGAAEDSFSKLALASLSLIG